MRDVYKRQVYVFRLTLRALRNREAECGSLKRAG